MQDPRHVPNPLRPYYVPPSIDHGAKGAANATSAATAKPSSFSFPDIDYSDYIPEASPSVTGSIKTILDQALWKYVNVAMAQPFEVAKLILQVRVAQEDDLDLATMPPEPSGAQEAQGLTIDYDNSSDDEPNFFTSSSPFDDSIRSRSPKRGRRGRPPRPDTENTAQQSTQPQSSPHRLKLKAPHSLLDALSTLSSNSGPLAMWRATNTTFIYSILARTIETFLRSFLAAVFGVSDPEILLSLSSGTIPDSTIIGSSFPAAAVLITTAAAAVSALILAPIDAARTRLIVTPASDEPRTLLGTLRTLSPSWLIPIHLLPITLLTSSIPTLISTTTPLFLRSYLKLDPALNPASWSAATFFGSVVDLTLKFPLETVLRRAQIATWTAPNLAPPKTSSKRKAITTIVPVPQSYRGIGPTVWSIMRDEGYSESQKDRTAALMGKAPRRKRKGQGIEGLYRGWRVGLWGLVGVWGTAFVGSLSGGEVPGEGAGVHGGKF